MLNENTLNTSLLFRNKKWNQNAMIPSWVDINTVGLDQFFTKKDVAMKCYKQLLDLLHDQNEELSKVKFIEPSAGNGAFFDLLPKNSIGLDVMPLCSGVFKEDFLSWTPKKYHNNKLVFIGNPPFGYRGWLALSFMNHAAKFADYVAFILPMSFQSEGKGSPKNRVEGMTLIHSEIIESDSFYQPDGKIRKVNALWQIWKKGQSKATNVKPTCLSWIDMFTVDMRKERLCGQEKINHADFFLQRTYYKEPPSLVKSFSEVKYVCGYGLIIKKDKENIVKTLNEIDWRSYSNLAAHNCRHISMYHIEKALTDRGFIDV